MRINVGLPGPFSASGNLPPGLGLLILFLVLIVMLCCCGRSVIQNIVDHRNTSPFQCSSC